VGCEAGAAATLVGPSADVVAAAEAGVDAVPLGDGVAVAVVAGVDGVDGVVGDVGCAAEEDRADADVGGRAGLDGEVVAAVDRGFAAGRVLLVVRGALVGLGAVVVLRGVDVARGLLVVGAGLLVTAAAGGATRGCCPDPKRKPTTVPGAGS
jgi:hypothetical protein